VSTDVAVDVAVDVACSKRDPPVLQLTRLLTSMANLLPASLIAKEDHGPIRFMSLETMKPLAVTETQVIVLSNHLKGKTLFWMDLTAPDKIPLQNVP